MNPLTGSLPSLLAATVAFAIGTSVVLRDRSRDDFVLFAVFCFNLGLFHLATFFHEFSNISLFRWGAQSLSLVLPWTADRCFSSLIPAEERPRRRSRLQTAILVILLGAHATALFILLSRSPEQALDRVTRERFWDLAEWGPWDLVSVGLNAYVIVGLAFVALRMWRAANQAEGTATAPRLRYLFYASMGAIAFGSPALTAIGPIVSAVYLYFVAQTLQRERLLELPELAARILTLALLIMAVTGLLALLLLWIPAKTGSWTLFVFNSAVAAFAVIVLLDPVRQEFESRVETWLFRDRAELRALLVQLRFRLLNVIDPDVMVQVVLEALAESHRVTTASIFLLDARGTSLVLLREIGEHPVSLTRLDVAKRRPLLERLRTQGPQLRDVLQREHERAGRDAEVELQDCLDTLAELGAALAVPIVSVSDASSGAEGPERLRGSERVPARKASRETEGRRELIGALFVDDERLLEPFSSEEIELFESLASQAAVTLQNSAVWEQRKERERLAALGEMAAGLAHEIRNPLGAIKGAVQVVEPGLAGADEMTREFLGVIVEEVDRLNRVVTQFLRYSRPYSGEIEQVDLTEVVRATLRLLPRARVGRVKVDFGIFVEQVGELSAAEASSVSLTLEAHAPAVRGDPEALRQVLHNLVLNALDATEEQSPPGTVWIEFEHRMRGLPDTDAVAISVRDDGPGLSTATMSNLFVPFHTTKSGGTGLGLPISQRIVENHHGMIEVSNNPDGGVTFTVLLPVDLGITSTSQ
ncbi:Sensor protein ZraS [Enhygromyxa salina]|uniref:histidine kinase n=1 Tax=Enhygromyxa salina TaxID=215803 RepID=A0A2S9XBK0_9BACT|nr:ATP-binding protein [Enhygromyxa salina]PRP90071.1 Sensor protein ZraS [Enhygromyxa salina]